MNLKKYAQEAKRTNAKLPSKKMDNLHMVLGMVTEVAELANIFKTNMAYGKKIDWINVQEEIGDAMFYLINFCNINNFDLENILQNNIDKLKSRYPDKFTEQHALNRDLKKERKILEELGY